MNYIVGAGNLGREIYAYKGQPGDTAFIDDVVAPGTRIGCAFVQREISPHDYTVYPIVAISDPTARRRKSDELIAKNYRLAGYVHASTLHRSETLRSGVICLPFSLISTDCSIGRGLLMNVYSSIGHDCKVGSFVTLGPYAGIAGSCEIGDGVYIGMGAKVLPGVKIGDGATIGAGAVVVRDVSAGSLVFGNPARLSGVPK